MKEKDEKKKKEETKEEHLPWKVLYQAEIKNGFLRVGEVHKLTKTKKNVSAWRMGDEIFQTRVAWKSDGMVNEIIFMPP